MRKTTAKPKTTPKIKVGSFVRIRERKYRYSYYEGVVTESFTDLVQLYGVHSGDELDYHEIELEDNPVEVTPIEKEKLRFVFDQAVKQIEQNKLKAEIKFKQQENYLEEALTKRAHYLA
jgi:hypothetical protein